ncbi:GtrA family protein [Thiohalocapsa marina]|uniref:GtrA family protein n=1 Tax=Thiohalocapsa marina TaxID=424902 RepID=A0A5M8FCK0_9GAMM|nr:GtrA family protein [Thiohalocapsa marina]
MYWSRLRNEASGFLIVGGIGFVIDAAVLTFLVRNHGWGLYEARGVSFGLAVSATWYLNRKITFASRVGRYRRQEYLRYVSTQSLGAFVNLGVYAGVIAIVPGIGAWPVIPLSIASGIAMIFNFASARHFAFSSAQD